jgi:hypothetical protein
MLAAWGGFYLWWSRSAASAVTNTEAVDFNRDPGWMLHSLKLGLLATFNLDEGLQLPADAADVARWAVALALGLAAVWLAPTGRRQPSTTRDKTAGSRSSNPGVGARRREQGPLLGTSSGALFGVAWAVSSMIPLLGIGHRWSTYNNAMVGVGAALVGAALLRGRRPAAIALSAFLLISGPMADAATGGAFEQGSNSLHSLARLRRLSDFVDGLHRAVLASHPHMRHDAGILLSRVPNRSLVALHGSDALRSWYADSTLRMHYIEDLLPAAWPREAYIMDFDADASPPKWREEGQPFVGLRVRLQRAVDETHPAEAKQLLEEMRRTPDWEVPSAAWRAEQMVAIAKKYFAIGDHDAGGEMFRQALSEDSTSGDAHQGLGAYLFAQGNLEEAEKHMAKAVRLLPDDATACAGYGMILARVGRDPDAAAQWLRKALALGIAGKGRAVVENELQNLDRDTATSNNSIPGSADSRR